MILLLRQLLLLWLSAAGTDAQGTHDHEALDERLRQVRGQVGDGDVGFAQRADGRRRGGVRQRAKREIEAERDRAVAILRQETVDLSLAAASKLIEARLGSEADRKIVEDYLGALEENR